MEESKAIALIEVAKESGAFHAMSQPNGLDRIQEDQKTFFEALLPLLIANNVTALGVLTDAAEQNANRLQSGFDNGLHHFK